MIDVQEMLKAMEKKWEPIEGKWAMTMLFKTPNETCPIHNVGQKDLSSMNYVCPICHINLGFKEQHERTYTQTFANEQWPC